MKYLIDTDVIIDINKGIQPIMGQLSELSERGGEMFVSTFTFIEYYYGELGHGKERQALKFIDQFGLITLVQSSAKLYAELAHKYQKKGKMVSTFDLLTSAIAIDSGCMLLTRDKGFEKISELNKIVLQA